MSKLTSLFRRRRRVNGEPPAQASGDFDGTKGFTDFSEYAIAAGVPSGLTQFGAPAPTFEIADGGAEGLYIGTTGGITTFDQTGIGVDAFTGAQFGEILVRCYVEQAVNNRWWGGAFLGLGGATEALLTGHGATLFARSTTDHEMSTIQYSTGSAVVPAGGEDIPDGEVTEPGWYWMRVRLDDSTGETRYRIKLWLGAIGDEPVPWTRDATTPSTSPVQPTGLAGWGIVNSITGFDYRCAYIGFSNDPDTTPAPSPA